MTIDIGFRQERENRGEKEERERRGERREIEIERERGGVRKMGKKIAVEHNNRKKKKGRPSLLDVQKRYLRLQKEKEGEDEELQRNPNPNSKHRIDENRRGTKRNNPDDDELGGEGVDDDEEDDVGKRREKKLKFVHRLASNGMPNQTELDSSGSDSEGRGKSRTKKNRKIESVVEDGSHTEVMVKLRHKSLSFICSLFLFYIFGIAVVISVGFGGSRGSDLSVVHLHYGFLVM